MKEASEQGCHKTNPVQARRGFRLLTLASYNFKKDGEDKNMSVVIIGGNERMVCQYADICKCHGCKAKVFAKEHGSVRKKIGCPDDPVYQHGITQNGKHCDPGSKTEQHSGCKDPQQQCKCTALSTGRTLRGNVKRRFLMLERYLIEHCSPTLASVKTANLFTWSFAPEEMPEQQVRYWNQELQARGISLVVLRVQNQKALMYVCRKQRLQERLDDQEVQNFLGKYGYVQKDADYALQRLKERLAKAEGFPHEIGVFLDYPLEDVVGFIENAGQNYKCSGCWKVYCNECETRKLFAKYKKCREVYRRLWKQGRDIRTLTVAS